MSGKLRADISVEPERYELRAAAPYRFELDRRDFFRFLGAGLVVVSVLKPAFTLVKTEKLPCTQERLRLAKTFERH
jgi:hypothetical protein